MWSLYRKDGSSLSVDWNLCGEEESEIFLYFFSEFVCFDYYDDCYVFNDYGWDKRRFGNF